MLPGVDKTALTNPVTLNNCQGIRRQHRQDPLRRFTPTPHVADLSVMGRIIRLETNNPAILKRTTNLFSRYKRKSGDTADFLWRIASEPCQPYSPTWPENRAFSDDGLRYVSFGQHSYVAVDLDLREALGNIEESLVADGPGFVSPLLDTLFYLTAGALRLTSLEAACIAEGEKGLLVFGPPNSGKTTSCYLAARLGLELHADQAVFLENDAGKLCAWGDFWPAAFRPETLDFLPELQAMTRKFRYCDLTFFYLDKSRFQPLEARPVFPVSCVFLDRQRAPTPRLVPLTPGDVCRLLKESLPFKDDRRFERQQGAVLSTLSELPAYHLPYGQDPAQVATLFGKLLISHNVPEAWQ